MSESVELPPGAGSFCRPHKKGTGPPNFGLLVGAIRLWLTRRFLGAPRLLCGFSLLGGPAFGSRLFGFGSRCAVVDRVADHCVLLVRGCGRDIHRSGSEKQQAESARLGERRD